MSPVQALPAPSVEEAAQEDIVESLERPWRVVCHDDPLTTMDFVVDVFRQVFRLPLARSVELMMRVHNQGSAVIGMWPKTVAERKVGRAHSMARAQGFPLTLTIEPDD